MENTNTVAEIKLGSIVQFNRGWYRITKLTKNTVNLGSVFGNSVYYKSISKELVKEDEASWYANWQRSETYMSM